MRSPNHTEGPIEHPLQLVESKEQHPIARYKQEDAHKGHQTALGIVPIQNGIYVGIAKSAGELCR